MQGRDWTRVIFSQHKDGNYASVEAYLPENFQFQISSSYETPYGTPMSAFQILQDLAGVQAKLTVQTAQLWRGIEIPVFTMTLHFETESNPMQDIRDKVLTLLSWVIPSEDLKSGTLRSPGAVLDYDKITSLVGNLIKASSTQTMKNSEQPSNNNSASRDLYLGLRRELEQASKGAVQIQIGSYLFLDSCVITDVACDFPTVLDYATGWPQAVEVQVSFKPFILPTIEQWYDMFREHVLDDDYDYTGANKHNGVIAGMVGKVTGLVGNVQNKAENFIKDNVTLDNIKKLW